MSDGTGGVQAVERALAILDLFDERTEELTIAAAAERLGVHRSTASRLLAPGEKPAPAPVGGGPRLGGALAPRPAGGPASPPAASSPSRPAPASRSPGW